MKKETRMSKRLRVGVIGCGKIAQVRHIPEYALREDVDILAVSDLNAERAQKLADKYGIPHAYQDYLEMLQLPGLDAVSVCAPNALHAEAAIQALRKKMHVLVEKPMATRLDDCELMVAAAKQSGKLLMVAQNQRFHPVHRRVKEILQSGCLGRVSQFSTSFHHGGPENWSVDGANSWFRKREEAGYGVIGDLAIHKIDLIQWLLGERVEESYALHTTVHKERDVEDNAVLIMRLSSGTVGTVNVGWNNPLQEHKTVLYAEKGVLTFGETLFGYKVEFFDGSRVEEEIEPNLRPDGNLRSGVIDHFVECASMGLKPECDGESVLESMRVVADAVVTGAWA
jgi:predicted dehydrogenase